MANPRCKDLMTPNPRYLEPQATLLDAIRLMKEIDVGFVAICQQDRRLVGVLTDRDVALALADDRRPSEVGCEEVMTRDPVTARPDEDAFECARRMEEHQIRRIPVVDENNRLVGVIALADIARASHQARDLEGELPTIMQSISQPSQTQ